VKINRTAMIDYVDARIAETTNEKHLAQLQVLRAHMHGEVTEDVDALLATISPKRVQYRTWGATPDLEPDSHEGVREFYYERKRLGQLYFQFDIDRLIVADDALVTDGVMHSLMPGQVAAYLGLGEVDESAIYLVDTRMIITWPFDDNGLLIGEESYTVPVKLERLDPADVPQEYLAAHGV